jgi:predicted membrane channel-forming protein YqfA (hemolysin III family)
MRKERQKRTLQLALWTWTWVATLAIATFGPIFFWDGNSTWTALAIGFNLLIGILMILANRKLFNHYDELERKIHLEVMGLTLGAVVVVGLSYSLLGQSNIISSKAEISQLILFLGVFHIIVLGINRKRYL